MTSLWTHRDAHDRLPADNVEAERQRAELLAALLLAERSAFDTQAEPGVYGSEKRNC